MKNLNKIFNTVTKAVKSAFQPVEVEVTFKKAGGIVTYTYSKVAH